MYKFLALYEKPADVPQFLDHYENVHTPLAKKIPGLQRLVVNRITANAFGGRPPYFLIAEMHFATQADFETAMRSDENRATGQDAMKFAGDLITGLVAESYEA